MIANFKKEAMEAHEKYVNFKEKHNKEVRDLNKLQIRTGNTGDKVTEIKREVISRKKFCPNSAIPPQHLNEDSNLVKIKSWIIDFKNYLNAGYYDGVSKKGHYAQMRPLVDKF